MHRWMVIESFIAGSFAFVVAWGYAVTEWNKHTLQRNLLTVCSFGAAGTAFFLFSLCSALHLGGHHMLAHACRFLAYGLALPVVAGLSYVAVVNTREAIARRRLRRNQPRKDSPRSPPNPSA